MSRYRSVTITTDVDIDMSDISDEDLEDEMELRGLGGTESAREAIEEMFYALKFGKDDRAMELARQIAQDVTGRILP